MRHGSCLALFDDFPLLWQGVELPYRRGVFPRRGVSYFEFSLLCEILKVLFCVTPSSWGAPPTVAAGGSARVPPTREGRCVFHLHEKVGAGSTGQRVSHRHGEVGACSTDQEVTPRVPLLLVFSLWCGCVAVVVV